MLTANNQISEFVIAWLLIQMVAKCFPIELDDGEPGLSLNDCLFRSYFMLLTPDYC